jgi:hypothetical protein
LPWTFPPDPLLAADLDGCPLSVNSRSTSEGAAAVFRKRSFDGIDGKMVRGTGAR